MLWTRRSIRAKALGIKRPGNRRVGEGREGEGCRCVRQQASPERIQARGKEGLALHGGLVVQAVAVELGDGGGGDDDAFGEAGVEDVEGEQEGGAEGWREPVVGRGEEGQHVDLGAALRAGDVAGRSDGDCKEGREGRHGGGCFWMATVGGGGSCLLLLSERGAGEGGGEEGVLESTEAGSSGCMTNWVISQRWLVSDKGFFGTICRQSELHPAACTVVAVGISIALEPQRDVDSIIDA